MSDPHDQTRGLRTGRPVLPAMDVARARREERDALEEAVSALEGGPPRQEMTFRTGSREKKHREGAGREKPDAMPPGWNWPQDRIIDRG